MRARNFFDAGVGAEIKYGGDDSGDYVEPWDQIEETPEQSQRRIEREIYREAAEKALGVLVCLLDFIKSGNPKQLGYRVDLVAYVFGHGSMAGMSLESLGIKYDKTRAAISAQLLRLQRTTRLEEGLGQKPQSARQGYSISRKNKLTKNICKTHN